MEIVAPLGENSIEVKFGFMVKSVILVVILVVVAFAVYIILFEKEAEIDLESFLLNSEVIHCSNDAECAGVITECGSCTDYTHAINKRYVDEFRILRKKSKTSVLDSQVRCEEAI